MQLITVLLLLVSNVALSVERFQRIGVDDGLPNATVYSVNQDQTGFIWLGSTNSGLLRFDGYRFASFSLLTAAEQLQHQTPDVGVIIFDNADRLWAGTWGLGLSVIDAHSGELHRFTSADGLAGDLVQALLQDNAGNIWVGTATGLSKITTDFQIITVGAADAAQPLIDQRIWSLSQSEDGSIWIGTSAGLHRWQADSGLSKVVELVPGADRLSRANEIRALLADGSKLWIGSRSGLYQYSFANDKLSDAAIIGTGSLLINVLAFDRSNNDLLIGSYTGLHRFDMAAPAGAAALTGVARLAQVNVRSILQDRTGVLWLGSREGGVYRSIITSKSFSGIADYAPAFAGKNFSVTAVFKFAQQLWLGSTDKVILLDTNTGSGNGSYQQIMTDSRVNAIAQTPDKHVYIATDTGLFLHNNAALERVDTPFVLAGVVNRNVRDLHIANDGTFYLGLWGEGVVAWQPQTGHTRHWLKDLARTRVGDAVQNVFVSADQQLWVATRYSGLYQIDLTDGNIIQHSSSKHTRLQLPHDDVHCVRQYAQQLLVCTREGAVLYDRATGRRQLITTADGLPANNVLGGYQMDEQQLWLMTANGLSFRPDPTQRFIHYNSQDGLVSSELNANAVYAGKHKLYFGAVAGLVVVKPESLQSNRQQPLPVLSSLMIDQQPRQFRPHQHSWPLIEILPTQHTMMFEFSALDFQDPLRNRFYYQLEGIDQDWVQAQGNTAYYANLAPGTYPLWLKASNNHGVFSDEQQVATVLVLPHWWQQRSVLLIVVLMLLALLWLLHQYRLRHIRQINRLLQGAMENKAKAQLILETRVTERTRALEESSVTLSLRTKQLEQSLDELAKTNRELKRLDKLKDEFIATVSHELRTPLTAIRGAIGLIAQKVVTPDTAVYNNMLQTAQSNSERLAQLINDLLDLQKFAAGTFTLNLAKVNLSELAQQAVSAMQPYAARFKINLVFEPAAGSEALWVQADTLRLRQVMDNLISNAVKFSPPASVVVVRLSSNEHDVRFEVEDCGAGIPAAFQSRIFQKFSQADSSDSRLKEGTGLGLAICKKIIENHQGQISFSTTPGEGSIFWFKLALCLTPA
ncbi:sensor histidine kinase [Rheinheimera sp.]|uniref:sensor histidine kinase n=1 Tax=Rheinheimera sp. TaxID=1869214 RepID=UPI0027367FB7|nr:sensor histidine kinase [Rheinheimera sp.]MDP2715978.1 ATP-binding protein [Rheinheimera sp.]